MLRNIATPYIYDCMVLLVRMFVSCTHIRFSIPIVFNGNPGNPLRVSWTKSESGHWHCKERRPVYWRRKRTQLEKGQAFRRGTIGKVLQTKDYLRIVFYVYRTHTVQGHAEVFTSPESFHWPLFLFCLRNKYFCTRGVSNCARGDGGCRTGDYMYFNSQNIRIVFLYNYWSPYKM